MPFDGADGRAPLVVDVLLRAHSLIEQPGTWIQGRYCRLPYQEEPLIAYCAVAAIAIAAGRRPPDTVKAAELLEPYTQELVGAMGFLTRTRYRLTGVRPSTAMVHYNDRHTHQEVLELFARAIARLRNRVAVNLPQHSRELV